MQGRVPGAGLCDKVLAVKMQRIVVVLTGVLGVGVLVGCGGGEDEPNPLRTRDGFCSEWATRACNEQVVDACSAASVEACREAQQEHCQSLVSADAYRERDARACLDAVRNALEDANLTAAETSTVLRGEGPCSFSCVDVGDGCVEPTVVGGGEECSDEDVVCDQGFYCDGSNCLAKKREDQECSDEIPCQEELKCAGAAGSQVCEARLANGEECAIDDDCQSGICTEATDGNICSARIILSTAEPACTKFR